MLHLTYIIFSLINILDIFDSLPPFFQNTQGKVILSIIALAILLLLIYIIYHFIDGILAILKLLFLFLFNLIRAILFVLIVIIVSTITWLFIIPIKVFFQKHEMKILALKYRVSLIKIWNWIYPRSKKAVPLLAVKLQTERSHKAEKDIQAEKEEKENIAEKKESLRVPDQKESNSPQYHCSNCGKVMSESMIALLNKGEIAFCDECGHKFKTEGGVPYPFRD